MAPSGSTSPDGENRAEFASENDFHVQASQQSLGSNGPLLLQLEIPPIQPTSGISPHFIAPVSKR